MDNRTALFLGEQADWSQARVALHDIHGLWGGVAVTVWGSGRIEVQQQAPARTTGHWVGELPADAVQALFRLCIEHDFMTVIIPSRPGIPDEGHPQITLFNARGDVFALGKWARQAEPRFDALARALREAAERVHLPPAP